MSTPRRPAPRSSAAPMTATGCRISWVVTGKKWRGPESNRRHHGFQPCALPTELPRRGWPGKSIERQTPACLHRLAFLAVTDRLAVIGAALDLGAGRRGVDMGPSAIRYAGLDERLVRLGFTCDDRGNVRAATPGATGPGGPRARFPDQIKKTREGIAEMVSTALTDDHLPIVLGGDHSIAIGNLGGLAASRGTGAALWFDAHGDLNTPATTPSGNVHGMPLAAALGLANDSFASDSWPLPALAPERVALIGVRSLDKGERELVRDLGVAVYTMADVDRGGVESVVHEALERVEGAPFMHVSLDMDSLDPEVAPGVGTPVRGGLSYREAHLAMELVAESGFMTSMDVVEVNPILDRENSTAELAVELVASALGEKIL